METPTLQKEDFETNEGETEDLLKHPERRPGGDAAWQAASTILTKKIGLGLGDDDDGC